MSTDMSQLDFDDLMHLVENEVLEQHTPLNLRGADDAGPAYCRLLCCTVVTRTAEEMLAELEQIDPRRRGSRVRVQVALLKKLLDAGRRAS